MPNDNFQPRPRREHGMDGFINNNAPGARFGSSDFIARRRITSQPTAGHRIGDFNRPEGYHASRQPIMPGQSQSSIGDQQGPALHKDLKPKRLPLLRSKGDRDRRRLPKANWRRRTIKWTKRVTVSLVVLAIVVGGFLGIKSYLKLHQVFGGHASALSTSKPGRINILLLGIGGEGHDGPDLTDTMLLASIDPVNNKADLLSIPRDLWVKMPNNYIANYQKINAAYESGKYNYLGQEDDTNNNQNAINAGFKAVDSTVSQVIGEPINYNVLVDFHAFQEGVNVVGGVTIDVPTELYDPTMAWQNHGSPIIAEPGIQKFGGTKALMYVRSRETTSDFARTERQRAVLLALKTKVLTLGTLSNPFKISSLLSVFGDNVRTDLSLNDAETLYGIIKKINNNDIKSIGLADPPNNFVTTGNLGGISIVEPTAGPYDYSAIQNFVRSTLRNGYLVKENAKILVLNGTTVPGAATQAADMLKNYGYDVSGVKDAPKQDYAKTIVVDLTNGKDKYTKQDLEQHFHGTTVTNTLDSSIQPNGANFVIIVGEDEATSS